MYTKISVIFIFSLLIIPFIKNCNADLYQNKNINNGAPFNLIEKYQKARSQMEKCTLSGEILYKYCIINNLDAVGQWEIINYNDCIHP